MTVPTGFPLGDGPLIGTWPRILWQVAWNAGGNSTDPNHWYTVSKRLRGKWAAGLSGRQYELDTAQAGTVQLTLDSLDGAFDPDNTTSPFYPHVVPYRRLRLVMMTSPSRNLLYPWVAAGTKTTSMASSTGTTTGTASGLAAPPSGLTTAQTWTIPNGTASGVAFGLWGDVQPWTSHDCEGTTVTPGASYSLALDVQLASGGMTSLTVTPRIGWYDLNGNLLSRSSGTTMSVTTAWSRLTATGSAPAGAAFAIASLATSAATTATTTVRATGWQLEQAAAPTGYVSPGNWRQLWQGFVESFTQRYDQNGKYALADVTGVDALAPLSRLTLGYVMPGWLASTSPQYSFDLAAVAASPDVAGGTAFLDQGGTSAALDIVGSAITTGASISSTTDVGTLWNVPGPVITLTNNQSASLGNSSGATYLQPFDGTDNLMLPSSGGWTRMICFRTTNLPGSGGRYSLATLWAASNTGFISGSGSAQDGAYLYINSSGNVGLNVETGNGTSLALVNPSINVCDGNWHCAIASLSSDGMTIQVTVDNTGWFRTGTTDQHGTYTKDAIGTLLVDSSANTQPFNGDMAYFAQWNSELDGTTKDTLARGFALGWAGDDIATRISNILTASGFHPGTAVSYSFFGSIGTLGTVATNGRSPVEVIQEAADSENGQFAITLGGTPVLYGHTWRWKQSTPRVTFGENSAGGEIPYAGDITFATDPAHLYSNVQVTCDGATDATDTTRVQEATDSTSESAYFPQTLTRTVNVESVSDGKNMADYLLSQYKDPHTRIGQITIDLAHSPALQDQVAVLAFSDLVRVMRRPALAPAKTLDGFIEQMEWSGDDTGAALQLRLQVSPSSQYRYWMFSAWHTTLAAAPAVGTTTLSINAPQVTQVYNSTFASAGTWQVVGGNATPGPITVTSDGGTTAYQASTYTILEDQTSIPYDPTLTYRVSVTVRTATAPVSGSPIVYLGLTGITATGSRVNINGSNSLSSQFYCAARAQTVGSSTYTTYVGYVSGTATPGDAGPNPDPASPERLRPEVVAVRPLMYLLYQCTDGVQYVDSFTIHTVPTGGGVPLAAQLPAGQQFTLGQGTATAETVTVSAVSATSPGWVTGTITLASATTQAHSAGDTVCEPLPPNLSLPPAPATYPTCLDGASFLGGTSPLFGF